MDYFNCDNNSLQILKEPCMDKNNKINLNDICIDNMNLWFYKCKENRIVKDWFLY